jgi:hypothetical protein
VLVATLFALAGIGAGEWSLDNALGIDLDGTGWAVAALGAGVLGALGALLAGRLGADRGTDRDQPSPA